jgi:hypothetical protein
MTTSKKMAVFQVVAPCNLVEVYRRFTGAYYFHYLEHNSPKDGGSTFETSVNFYQNTLLNNLEKSNSAAQNHKGLHLTWFIAISGQKQWS